jgi:peptidoglycan/xylan/chitin deacetylase (PgdA/CDA1 family)
MDGMTERARTPELWHDRVLGSRPVASSFSVLTQRRLRVLAYHNVDPIDRFIKHIAWLTACWRFVTLEDVAEAIAAGKRLPERAVWITFDDGHPEVIHAARPILDRYGISATLFVCPGLVDTEEPFWWDVIADAQMVLGDESVTTLDDATVSTVTRLKRLPDTDRRQAVEESRARVVAARGRPPTRRQLRADELRDWIAAGHSIGNHSWDHPCLDQCTPAEQTRQIVQADNWLSRFGSDKPKAFAYPNGNWVAHAENVLCALGYQVGVLFDHRLARVDQSGLRVSRLRVSAEASLPRLRAIVSGSHPTAFSLFRR